MRRGLDQQKLAVNSGIWPLYRYNPDLLKEGKNPLHVGFQGSDSFGEGLCIQRNPLPPAFTGG